LLKVKVRRLSDNNLLLRWAEKAVDRVGKEKHPQRRVVTCRRVVDIRYKQKELKAKKNSCVASLSEVKPFMINPFWGMQCIGKR
jgi:hypothetical protein